MFPVPEILRTQRLTLTLRAPSDLPDMLDLDDDPDVTRYVGDTSPRAERETYWQQAMTTHTQSPVMIIRYGDSQEFLGWAFLRPFNDQSGDWELGFRLKKVAWGQGIGTEACRALVAWGWSQRAIQTIVAGYEIPNIASLNVLLKLGMKQVGLRHYVGDGDFPCCSISRPDEARPDERH